MKQDFMWIPKPKISFCVLVLRILVEGCMDVIW